MIKTRKYTRPKKKRIKSTNVAENTTRCSKTWILRDKNLRIYIIYAGKKKKIILLCTHGEKTINIHMKSK